MNARPAQRAAHIKSRFEDNCRRPRSVAVELDSAPTDVDQFAGWREFFRGSTPTVQLVCRSYDGRQQEKADDPKADATEPLLHEIRKVD